jgi:5'-nucleotidase
LTVNEARCARQSDAHDSAVGDYEYAVDAAHRHPRVQCSPALGAATPEEQAVHILVTNDDGVQAPGLLQLAKALSSIGSVSVLAPERNWSASGHVKTMHRPLRVRPTRLADGTPALSSDGAPSDCVALAVLGLVEQPIDLVVSGINPSANVGHDLTYSGTVTAAMEGAIAGITSLAVSLDVPADHSAPIDYRAAAEVACSIADQILAKPPQSGTLLNVNIPYGPTTDLRGIRVTRQGNRVYHDELVKRTDPRGHPYYWIGGQAPTGMADEGTDFWALAKKCVSITPLHLDLTAHDRLDSYAWLHL